MLRKAVVLIDPMLNPDGRNVFAQRNHEPVGRIPSSEEDDWTPERFPGAVAAYEARIGAGRVIVYAEEPISGLFSAG